MTSLFHKLFDSMSVEVRVNRTKLISGAVKTPVVPAQSTLLFQSYWNQKVLDTTRGTCSQGMTVRDSNLFSLLLSLGL